jgi:hypothetical protein
LSGGRNCGGRVDPRLDRQLTFLGMRTIRDPGACLAGSGGQRAKGAKSGVGRSEGHTNGAPQQRTINFLGTVYGVRTTYLPVPVIALRTIRTYGVLRRSAINTV